MTNSISFRCFIVCLIPCSNSATLFAHARTRSMCPHPILQQSRDNAILQRGDANIGAALPAIAPAPLSIAYPVRAATGFAPAKAADQRDRMLLHLLILLPD